MNLRTLMVFPLLALVTACAPSRLLGPTPTPLPCWRCLVSELLLEDGDLPEGWARDRDWPVNSLSDPTINHVHRSWWGKAQGAGGVEQDIWRAYTVEEAREKFDELRHQGMFLPDFTPSPWDFYVPFEPPPEIDFRSQTADEFYLTCGWLYGAQCHVIARYRNYVTWLTLDLEAEREGHVSHGLTYEEIEAIIRAMDGRFTAFLVEHPLITPTPQP